MNLKFYDLNIIPILLCKDLMPNFNEFIQVYGCSLKMRCSPLKNRMPKNLTIAKFGTQSLNPG